MTDLEITKLCAEAMGFDPSEDVDGIYIHDLDGFASDYDPLHDDAQAMALVKKAKLDITPSGNVWEVWDAARASQGYNSARDADLNRAICECVAKMQNGKS